MAGQDMDDIYKKLCNKAGVNNSFNFGDDDYSSKKKDIFEFKMWYIYIIFPILAFIILYFNKPCFVADTLYDNTGKMVKKVNLSKAALYAFIIGILIDLGVYGMFLRKCK